MKVAAVIAAGGTGTRLGKRLHKPFVPLAGRPILGRTLAVFEKTPAIDGIVVVTHPADIQAAWRMIRRYGFSKVVAVVAGGASRMASVAQGLKALPSEVRWVAVHDAARPLVTRKVIEETLRAARGAKAAIAAVPVVPTIKEAKVNWVKGTLDRKNLWEVQTPQVFDRRLLEHAHEKGKSRGIVATDDAALVEAIGHRVRLVMGSHRNIKVTTPEDLVIAEALLAAYRGKDGVER